MEPHEIEEFLKQLDNGEISEDETSDNEDDIDYFPDQREADNDDVENLPADFDLDADLLSTQTFLDNSHIISIDSNPLKKNSNCNSRNMVWKRANMNIVENAFKFEGNTIYPQEILDLETPFQFLSYFMDEEMLKFLVDESNKYAFQKNPNFSELITIANYVNFMGFLYLLVFTITHLLGLTGQIM